MKVRVEVWDEDTTSSNDLIATYTSEGLSISSKVPTLQHIDLLKTDQTHYNSDVK